MKRRAVLSSTACGLGALSGCSSLGNESSHEQSTGSGEAGDRIRIRSLHVSSTHNETHTISIQVENQDSIVHDEEYNMDAVPYDDGYPELADTTVVDLGEWQQEPADYTVRASMESGAVQEIHLPEALSTECVGLRVRVNRNGEFGVLASTGCER